MFFLLSSCVTKELASVPNKKDSRQLTKAEQKRLEGKLIMPIDSLKKK